MIAVLCGGVGAARMLGGLVQVTDAKELFCVVNTGDDTVMHGLYICPDLDTITYSLAGEVNSETGWGLKDESWQALRSLERLGGEERSWFRLGDRDLGTHLYRTGRLAEGARLSEVTAEITAGFGVGPRLVPMSDDPVRTVLTRPSGERLSFQEYFVRHRHDVVVSEVTFDHVAEARPAPGVLEALEEAETVVVAPSNPIVSIGPIISVPGVRRVLEKRRLSVVAVSPIVGGAAIKGPADRLMRELGGESSAVGVARLLAPIAGSLVIDVLDRELAGEVLGLGLTPVVTETVMSDEATAARLAETVLGAS